MAYSLERLAGVRKSEMLKSLKHDCVKTCSNRLVKMMENKEKKNALTCYTNGAMDFHEFHD